MVEIKSVKVDNWGVFFLQKLQNFFNKTDYCDLTLQFNDNSQLKVHRLVLSACTDFFNVLEQQYEMTDDILVMPTDLQADVVVPIVNFMYTGTLEFEVTMYARLLKTARDMNMTVLLKLLEAHKRTVELPATGTQKPVPILLNKGASQRMNTYSRSTPANTTQTRTYTQKKTTPVKMKQEKVDYKYASRPNQSVSYLRKNIPEPVKLVSRYGNTSAATLKGPSRFDCSDETTLTEQFESSFDNISYESRPLQTASQIIKEERLEDDEPSTSFEQLRKSYTGVKRPLSSHSFSMSPPEKKPNIQDVKEYTEAHRLRKEIVAEEFNDEEYVDDEDELQVHHGAGKESTLVYKNTDAASNSGGNMNHAKIISEVLKKYPHLVKNNKNIKLKIMQKGGTAAVAGTTTAQQSVPAPPQPAQRSAPTVSTPSAAPKKIDSKTMHALIAKGAENMTGPWLCLKCGINGRPISIPSYKGFRRHLINTHKQQIDAKICEHCGWKASKKADLIPHMATKHNIDFPKCDECTFYAPDTNALNKHRDKVHPRSKNTHHCIYCNKTFSNEVLVYAHMRNNHKERAREDGVMDFDDDEEEHYDESDKYIPNNEMGMGATGSESKIKILSNISLPVLSQKSNRNLEPSSEAEALSNVASGIATSLGVLGAGNSNLILHNEDYIEAAIAEVHNDYSSKDKTTIDEDTEFVTEEGSTLNLTPSQKADLLQQLENQRGMVMILNDDGFDSQEMISADSDQGIVVVYSQSNDDGTKDNIQTTSALIDSEPMITSSAATDEIISGNEHSQSSEQWNAAEQVPKSESDMELEPHDTSSQNDSFMETQHEDEEDEEEDKEMEELSAEINTGLSANDEKVDITDVKNEIVAEDSQVDAKSSTKKLISALEGDWSEDEDVDAKEPTVEQAEKITTRATRSSARDKEKQAAAPSVPAETDAKTKKKSTDTKKIVEVIDEHVEKNLSELLDDWSDETNKPSKDDVKIEEDSPAYKESAEEKATKKESATKEEIATTELSKNKVEKKNDASKAVASTSEKPTAGDKTKKLSTDKKSTSPETTSKSEIKTLINDWGDDDENDEE